MRRFIPLSSMVILLLLSGCANVISNSYTYEINKELPKLTNIKSVSNNTSIAFEWQPVSSLKLDGVSIYRSAPNALAINNQKELTKIATITNPFASHYVDKDLQQNSNYTYTFTTLKGIYESTYGEILDVKTLPSLEEVTFFQGTQKASNMIKIIWRPHSDIRIKSYKIERSLNGAEWKWIDSVNDRMLCEYVDTTIVPYNRYQYRVIAIGFDGSFSKPSPIVSIDSK